MKPNETKSVKVCYLKPMMEVLLVDNYPLMDTRRIVTKVPAQSRLMPNPYRYSN